MYPLRYHTIGLYYQEVFGHPMQKAVIDAGFTCPNLDGTISVGGCIFCHGGSGAFAHIGTISEQLNAEWIRIQKKQPSAKMIAYFQAHTNTYGTPAHLYRCYTEALQFPSVQGLSIGTRPDCLPIPVLDILEELSKETALTVELGLQTIHDGTAHIMHRGYSFDVFLDAFDELRKRGIRTCVHIINGLPNEIDADMLETARVLGRLRPDGVKIHSLHILRGTPLAVLWEKGEFQTLSQAEYVQITAAQLSLLPEETVIERVTGDGEAAAMLAPSWSMDKRAVRNAITQHLKRTDSWQGKNYKA